MKQIKLTKDQKEQVAEILSDATRNCAESLEIVDINDILGIVDANDDSKYAEDECDARWAAAELPIIDEFIKLLQARKKHNLKFIAKVEKKIKR